HGSVDWFWEFPVLGMEAFAMLGLAVSLLPRPAVSRAAAQPLAAVPAAWAAVGVAVVVIGLGLLSPWLSARATRDAAKSWPTDLLARPPAHPQPARRHRSAGAQADARRQAHLGRRGERHPAAAHEEAGAVLRAWMRIGLKIVYWLAVLAVSIVILVVLIMLIESRDK